MTTTDPANYAPFSSRAERNIAWIERHCRIPEGTFAGKRVKLREWQKDELRKIYDNPHGTRRAIISFARKNAKTALVAFLLLLHAAGPEARMNSQLNSAAQSKDQAAILFKLAAKCVRQSPTLAPVLTIRDTVKEIYCPELGTLYKALSAEASTAYGLSPCFIVHDELGQVKGPHSDLYEALETAVGAHDAPLSIVISTQAATDNDLLSILIDDAIAGNDPRVVLSLYTAPMEADPFIRETIVLANPALGDFLNEAEVMAMAEDAKRMPAREPAFRNLILNQRVEATTPFVSRSLWLENADAPTDLLDCDDIYGGLDLSEVNDLTALVWCGKPQIRRTDQRWAVHPVFWLPEFGLAERAKRDRTPYDLWHGQGKLLAVPGKSIEYSYVAAHLRKEFNRLGRRIKKLAFDRWNFRHLKPWLLQAGFTEKDIEDYFLEFGQGFQSMSPALRELESDLLNSKIAHGKHPVLTMCAANAVVEIDPAGNKKLTKKKSSGRIDGMVALAMARGAVPAEQPPVMDLNAWLNNPVTV